MEILSSDSVSRCRSPSVNDFTFGSIALRVIAVLFISVLFNGCESFVIALITASHASFASFISRLSSGVESNVNITPELTRMNQFYSTLFTNLKLSCNCYTMN